MSNASFWCVSHSLHRASTTFEYVISDTDNICILSDRHCVLGSALSQCFGEGRGTMIDVLCFTISLIDVNVLISWVTAIYLILALVFDFSWYILECFLFNNHILFQYWTHYHRRGLHIDRHDLHNKILNEFHLNFMRYTTRKNGLFANVITPVYVTLTACALSIHDQLQ